jgi:RNA polymerase sigma-70 factor (ECF subfamily)
MRERESVRQSQPGELERYDDVALLRALLSAPAGDPRERCWAELVRRFERLITVCIVKALRRYGALYSREDLEDLTGEVWLALLKDDLRKLRQYDAGRGARITTFLGLVATNLTIDHLRARRAETCALDDAVVAQLVVSSSDTAEERERVGLARRALDYLTADERAFILDCFHEEHPPEELARSRGITIGTAYTRKFKVRVKLRRIVSQLEADHRGSAAG